MPKLLDLKTTLLDLLLSDNPPRAFSYLLSQTLLEAKGCYQKTCNCSTHNELYEWQLDMLEIVGGFRHKTLKNNSFPLPKTALGRGDGLCTEEWAMEKDVKTLRKTTGIPPAAL
jgi:hypothetical protein